MTFCAARARRAPGIPLPPPLGSPRRPARFTSRARAAAVSGE